MREGRRFPRTPASGSCHLPSEPDGAVARLNQPRFRAHELGVHVSTPNNRPSSDVPSRAALDVSGLRVDTPQGHPIIEGVSLDLKAGEILGIVGESGSGKTTTA